jgi:hypothetical protein
MTDVMNMIDRRPLIDDYTPMPKVQVPMKQPRDTDEKSGLAIPQCQEHGPQSPWEVSSIPTIAVELCSHGIPTRWRANVLPRCQLCPCHLEKEKKTRVNNHKKLDFVNQKQR